MNYRLCAGGWYRGAVTGRTFETRIEPGEGNPCKMEGNDPAPLLLLGRRLQSHGVVDWWRVEDSTGAVHGEWRRAAPVEVNGE